MSVDLDRMCAKTLCTEAGFVDDPDDNGGATNCGVSLVYARSLPKVDGRSPMDLNGDGVVDIEDIRLVTPAIAKKLFLQSFFYDARVPELPECIQPMHFDMNVNGGNGGGARVLQLALVAQSCLVRIDGQMGDQTIAAANKVHARVGDQAFKTTYVGARITRYRQIVARDPSQRKFLNGWIARARSFA